MNYGACYVCKTEFKNKKLLIKHQNKTKHKGCFVWVGTLKQVLKKIDYDPSRFFII